MRCGCGLPYTSKNLIFSYYIPTHEPLMPDPKLGYYGLQFNALTNYTVNNVRDHVIPRVFWFTYLYLCMCIVYDLVSLHFSCM